ncbi:MAG: phage holin family protein [Bacteroidales bacterium]|nr:phage holin family protein [Bacteroidales bacterium]
MKERTFKDYYKIFKRDITQYIDLRLDYLKLEGIEVFSNISSKLITVIFGLFFGVIFITFLLFALAFFLGEILGANYWGFLIVSGIFLLFALLFFVFRKLLLQNPLVNALTTSLFQNKDEKQNKYTNEKKS